MSNATTTTSAPQTQRAKGPVSGLISLLSAIIAMLIFSLLLSLAMEWLGMAFWWKEEGVMHSYRMLEVEKSYLSNDFKENLFIANVQQLSGRIIEISYDWLFVKSGMVALLENARNHPKSSEFLTYLNNVQDYAEAAIYVILIFIIRLMILVLTAPLFVLTGLTGFVDGLVRRDIRRFGSGYESGFIYHHSKRSIKPLFVFSWFLYLSLPFSLHPNWILIPASCLVGLAISITVGSFKKYL